MEGGYGDKGENSVNNKGNKPYCATGENSVNNKGNKPYCATVGNSGNSKRPSISTRNKINCLDGISLSGETPKKNNGISSSGETPKKKNGTNSSIRPPKEKYGTNSGSYPGYCGPSSSSYMSPMVSKSTISNLNEIMTTLTQSNIIKLGLYGSSNARNCKVEQIIRRVERGDGKFDKFVIASVEKKDKWLSKSPDVIKLQVELGKKLDLQFHEKTPPEERATCLRDEIKKKKKILIILNNLWCGIDLEEIGIPFGNDHEGCKIVLLAENQKVLSNEMKTEKEYSVD